jgi:hypothetical protein
MADSYEPQNPNTKLYLAAKKLQDWSPIITVIVSCIGLVVIGFQACIYNEQRKLMNEQRAIMDRQLDAMHKTLAETKKSADASVKSAGAAETQANASMTQASVSEQMVKQNERVVSAAETQANASKAQASTSQVSARAAEKSTSIAQIGLLPRIEATLPFVIFEPGKKIMMYVKLMNRGNTNAIDLQSLGYLMRFDPLGTPGKSNHHGGLPSVTNLIPGESVYLPLQPPATLKADEFQRIKDGERELRVWVVGRYDDEFGGRHPIEECWAYNKDLGVIGSCSREQRENNKPN